MEEGKHIYGLRITDYISRFTSRYIKVHILPDAVSYASLGWILCVPLILLTCASPPLVVPEYGARAPDFTLKDQNDQEVRLSQFRGENVLLFGFDKDGVDNGGTWLNLFLERYAEGMKILPIADGSSMPFSARLFLKGKVKAEAQDAAEEFNLSNFLLDWTGEISRQYGMAPKIPTIVLIDRAGHIRLVQPLPSLTEEGVRGVLDQIDWQLR